MNQLSFLFIFFIPFFGFSQNGSSGDVTTEVFTKDSLTYVKTTVINEAPVTTDQVLEIIKKLDEQITQAKQQLAQLESQKTEMLKIIGLIEKEQRKNKGK